MRSIRDYINLINEADINIDVRGIQQDAKLKAYQAAIAAGKSEAEAQNAEAAAGNTAGANALGKVNLNNPSTYINQPGQQAGPSSEAQRQEWMKDPTKAAAPAAKQWQPGVLGMGSSGPEVSALQTKLGIAADGKFGPGTQQAVMALQKKLGVNPDGAYGPVTKAAHDKMAPSQAGKPKDGTNQAAPGQPGYTTGAKKSEVQTGAAKQAAGRAELSAQTTDPDKTSLNARVTTAIPTVATPAGNAGGVGKNQTLTPDEKKAAEEALKDPNVGMKDKQYYAGLLGVPVPVQKTAPNVGAPAPVQKPTPASTAPTTPARPTSAVTADPTATTFPDGTPIERSQGNSSQAYMDQFGGSAPNQGARPAAAATTRARGSLLPSPPPRSSSSAAPPP